MLSDIYLYSLGVVAQQAEATDSKSVKCEFESHRPYFPNKKMCS